MRIWILGAFLSMTFIGLQSVSAQAPQVERPPQFVLLAFDGSLSHEMWKQTRQFAAEMKGQGKDVRFTYFISGVYYLAHKNRGQYLAPGYGAGRSHIGWGKDDADLLGRFEHTNQAFLEGHEIASHANGHFDGSKWTEEQWTSEFEQFYDFLFGFFRNNALTHVREFAKGWSFTKENVIGFRAPLLGYSPGLWTTLKKFNFRYDTSRVAAATYWPEKMRDGGYWNFPLASLRVAGSGKRTLSMDYNFYVAQSGGKPDLANAALYEEQTLQTYLQYFDLNYNGNRAPIDIGHHFSLWNDGAYWKALKRFAAAVCGLPEVRCVTYTELADFMDSLDEGTRLAYQRGQFHKAPQIRLAANDTRTYSTPFSLDFGETRRLYESGILSPDEVRALQGDLPEAHLDQAPDIFEHAH